jgi:PIN domain nuclease of toxin-antitoxin system
LKLLIDTHCWLWSLTEPERLNSKALAAIRRASNPLYLSAASSWEIAIKFALNKLTLPLPPWEFVPSRMSLQGLQALPIQHSHALRVAELPNHHRDLFDRLLVAQAQLEGLSLLTADEQLRAYDVDVFWAGP